MLFTYLTVSRALPSRREELIEALWPWQAPAGADTALSALLSRLRSVLGGEVLCGRGEIHLELPRDAWIDLEAAEEAIHRAEAAVAQEDWARGWGPSLVALFTARRGFLPGEDLTWAEDAPPAARGDPRRGARVLRRGRPRSRRLRTRPG